MESRGTRFVLRIGTVVTLLFLYVPLLVVVIYAFNESVSQAWPPTGFTTIWFRLAFGDAVVWDALLESLKIAAAVTVLALLLGSLASFAVHRYRFFGRQSVSFLLVLPIALPGIITGIALLTGIKSLGLTFSLWTIMIGHATFCIVVVFNNVIARLRRTPTSFIEASMDLGADGWQTFRHITLPAIATALVAGALLAFALSFDEIIVTNFVSGAEVTLPKWIFNTILRQPRNRPEANAVAALVMILSLIPVYLAQRLAGGGEESTMRGEGRPRAGGGARRASEPGRLEVLPAACGAVALLRRFRTPSGEAPAAEFLELGPCGGLLREHRGLDPVEQPLEPAHQLCLGDADLGLGGHALQRRRQLLEFTLEVGRQHHR